MLWALPYTILCIGVNLKSRNVLILCCDIIPLAKINAPQTLQRSIIRLVLVGLSVAIELQKRQYTIRSHGSIIGMLLYYNTSHPAIYIAPRECCGIVRLRRIYDGITDRRRNRDQILIGAF